MMHDDELGESCDQVLIALNKKQNKLFGGIIIKYYILKEQKSTQHICMYIICYPHDYCF